MDLNTITAVARPKARSELPAWTAGDAWLAGGTWLFSEPQVHLTRLIDLTELKWPALTVGDDSRAAGSRRNRHRLNEPLPGATSPDRAPRGGTSRDSGHGGAAPDSTRRSSGGFPDSTFPDSALRDDEAFPETGFPDVEFPGEEPLDAEWLDPLRGTAPRDAGQLEPLPDMAPRDRARRESPFPDWASRDDRPFPSGASRDRGRPDVEFPDVAFPDGTFGTSKRPDARRLPRHAAPAVGLGSKVSHWMTGLFARPATSGARG